METKTMILIAFLVPLLSKGLTVHIENYSVTPRLDAEAEPRRPIFKCDEDGVSPNPISCGGYIECLHHRRYVRVCPLGLHFSNETGTCVKPCDAHCDQNLACECGWSTCKATCASPNGIYAHPDKCEKFIQCADGKPTVFECSRGKAFDIIRKKCSPKDKVGCKINAENQLAVAI